MPQPQKDAGKEDGQDKIPLPEEMLGAGREIRVGDKTAWITVEDAFANAQKYAGADAKFREASEIRRQAVEDRQAMETEARVAKDLQDGFKNRDQEAIKRAFRAVGVTETEIEALFATQQAGPGDSLDDDEEDGDRNGRVGQLENTVAQLTQVVTKLNSAFERAQKTSVAKTERQQIAEALDRDGEIGEYLKEKPAQTRKWILDQVVSAVDEARRTLPWGPKAFASGIEKMKGELRAAGMLGRKPDDSEEPTGDQLPDEELYSPGFGPAAQAVGRLHRTQREPARVPMTSPDYRDNFAQRLFAKLRRK